MFSIIVLRIDNGPGIGNYSETLHDGLALTPETQPSASFETVTIGATHPVASQYQTRGVGLASGGPSVLPRTPQWTHTQLSPPNRMNQAYGEPPTGESRFISL